MYQIMNIIKEEKFLNYDIIEYDIVDSTMNVVKNFKAKKLQLEGRS